MPPEELSDNSGASLSVDYETDFDGQVTQATLHGLAGDLLSEKRTIALWDGPAEPTRQQCRELVITRGVESLIVTKDSRFCALTEQNRVAFVSGLSFSDTITVYVAMVKIWSATS